MHWKQVTVDMDKKMMYAMLFDVAQWDSFHHGLLGADQSSSYHQHWWNIMSWIGKSELDRLDNELDTKYCHESEVSNEWYYLSNVTGFSKNKTVIIMKQSWLGAFTR